MWEKENINLRRLRRTIRQCESTHRRSTGTLCDLSHSACTVLVVLKFSPLPQVMSPKLKLMVTFNRRLREQVSRRLLFNSHLSRIQLCQRSPRQIWYPSTELKGQSLALPQLPAQGDSKREQGSLAQEVLELSCLSRTTRRMSQDELAAMEHSRLAMFYQNQGFTSPRTSADSSRHSAWNSTLRSSTTNRPWR